MRLATPKLGSHDGITIAKTGVSSVGRNNRPHTDFTKLPVDLIREVQSIDLTTNSFSLYMFLIYKFFRPYEKEEQLSLNLNYLAKVIQTSSKTVKNSLLALIDNGLINCEFAKFQTHDPCIITLLFFSSRPKSTTKLPIEKHIEPVTAPTKNVETNLKIIQENINSSVTTTIPAIKVVKTTSELSQQSPQKTKSVETNSKPSDQMQTDLERVLGRHNRDKSDAPLIIKFLNDTSVGLDKMPIRSIPAIWEKDLQSNLKLLQFRFVEWKHQQEKEENKRFFEKQNTAINQLATLAAKVDVSAVKFDFDFTASGTTEKLDNKVVNANNGVGQSGYTTSKTIISTSSSEVNYFSNQTTKFSNQMNNFSLSLNKFSNNIRDLNIRNINSHIRGAESTNHQSFQKTNEQIAIASSDCDSFNFSTEELEAIKQYGQDKNSVRFLKSEDFIKRYLDIGVELLQTGKKINLDNISLLYAEKSKSSQCRYQQLAPKGASL